MGKASKALQYLIVSGGIGFLLMFVAKPSHQEVEQIKKIGKSRTYSEVIRAASEPSSKPLHMRKPGEQFMPRPAPEPEKK